MADYQITTDFSVKDTLPKGDAGKVVRGTEFHQEFRAIEDAVKTKTDRPTGGTGQVAVVVTVSGGYSYAPGGVALSDMVTLTGTQTLTNKTLTNPTVNGGTFNNVTLNSPSLTNVTLDNPTINSGITLDNAALLDFADTLGILPPVWAEISRPTSWNITSSTWVDFPFTVSTGAGQTIRGVSPAVGGVLTIPQGTRAGKVSVLIPGTAGGFDWRVYVGSGIVETGQQTPGSSDNLVEFYVTSANVGDTIRLSVNEYIGGTIINAGAYIKAHLA